VPGGFVGSVKKVPKAKEDSENKTHYAVECHVLFENCNNFGLVTDEGCEDLIVDNGDGTKTNKKQGLAGGILAYGVATTITFRNCTNTADVLSDNTGEDNGPGSKLNSSGGRDHAGEHVGGGVAGGIAGRCLQSSSEYHNDVYFYNCINSGDVVGWSQIGGIGGWINCGVHVFSCENRGQITSKANYAAGIIGRPGTDYENSGYTHDFVDCVNTGDVIAHRQYAGGISSYSRDRINMTRCLNTGDMMAEGVSATSQNPDQHTVICAGIMVNTSYTGFFAYCVNTGNMISNIRAAGICGAAGSEESSKYGGGYTTLVGCLNLGDISVYARDNGDVLADTVTYQNDKGETKVRYYWSTYNAAGILGYTWGGGAAQAPRIIGCGVQGTITTDWGCACGLMGYANTAYAMLQYNYVIADINGPGETDLPHQITLRTDYATEYLAAWIDRCDSLRYVYGNYCYADYANKYMMMQNNGADVDFTGYDCYITKDDLESGKVAYMLNDLVYQDYEDFGMGIKYCFAQDLTGKDGKYPTSPYYYLTLEGPVDNRVIVGFGNVVEKDGDGYKNTSVKVEETTEETTEEETTEKETEVVTTEPDVEVTTKADEVTTTDPSGDVTTAGGDDTKPAEGGCGGVIGASVALVALALIAPAGIMLKKKED
ncbi:MAG: hypothetical protein J6B77_02545, partial [Clostridia bacterium]|nr:hypothetical protein [Clostridia bacterium]